ncbi:MAG: cysteine hydrolase [Chloroflexota bacterium]|nr:cysteine hydrolase [Chloroflexota bacterium]
MPEPLLIVDVQNVFINDYTHHVPERILEQVERLDPAPIIFTRFRNRPDGPYPRLLGWEDGMDEPACEIVDALLDLASKNEVFDKPGTTGLPQELREHLVRSGLGKIHIAGIDTDMCVLKTALDIFDLGIEPIVLTDCCASTAGLQAHFAALAVLARNIGANRLVHTGTGEEALGAPRPDD